jgi:hypothetical protein
MLRRGLLAVRVCGWCHFDKLNAGATAPLLPFNNLWSLPLLSSSAAIQFLTGRDDAGKVC